MTTKTPASANLVIWDYDSSWSPTGLPTTNDDVVLGLPIDMQLQYRGYARSVTLSNPGAKLEVIFPPVTLSASVNLDAGTLRLNGALANGTLALAGGTLQLGQATFDNITVQGTLDIDADWTGYGAPYIDVAHNLELSTPGGVGLKLTTSGGFLNAGQFGASVGTLQDPVTIDGGSFVIGAADPTKPVWLDAFLANLTLGAGLSLDVVGATMLVGAVGTAIGKVSNAGTISIGPGGLLQVAGPLGGSGAIHIASGTLDLTGMGRTNSYSGMIIMDDAAAKVVIEAGQSINVTGFRAGDVIEVDGTPSGQSVQTLSGSTLPVFGGSITIDGTARSGATYTVTPGAGKALITTSAAPAAAVAFADAQSGAGGTHALDAVADGPSYLQWRYIDSGADTVSMSAAVPNVFLKGGSGTKAISVSSGQNVLDGGTGSSYLTGGTGTDTFFVDLRYGSQVWDTIRNFHVGDAVTLWGWSAGDTMAVDPSAAAAGAEGATLLFTDGSGTTLGKVTFSGMTSDAVSHLQQATGTQPAGTGLFLYNPGV